MVIRTALPDLSVYTFTGISGLNGMNLPCKTVETPSRPMRRPTPTSQAPRAYCSPMSFKVAVCTLTSPLRFKGALCVNGV